MRIARCHIGHGTVFNQDVINVSGSPQYHVPSNSFGFS